MKTDYKITRDKFMDNKESVHSAVASIIRDNEYNIDDSNTNIITIKNI
ncbi:MAG: hypothetical protein ACYST3_03150 [Planctomycetota bacterium]|jgi:hypothetical protein